MTYVHMGNIVALGSFTVVRSLVMGPAGSIDWRALYEWRVEELEERTRIVGQRLRQMTAKCAEQKNSRTAQVCPALAMHLLAIIAISISHGLDIVKLDSALLGWWCILRQQIELPCGHHSTKVVWHPIVMLV